MLRLRHRQLLLVAAAVAAAGLLAVAVDLASHAAPLVGGAIRHRLETITLTPHWQRRLSLAAYASLLVWMNMFMVTAWLTFGTRVATASRAFEPARPAHPSTAPRRAAAPEATAVRSVALIHF